MDGVAGVKGGVLGLIFDTIKASVRPLQCRLCYIESGFSGADVQYRQGKLLQYKQQHLPATKLDFSLKKSSDNLDFEILNASLRDLLPAENSPSLRSTCTQW